MQQPDLAQHVERLAAECGGMVSVAVRSIENAGDFALSDGEVVSSASVIKLPMLVEAMRQVAEGRLSLDMEFTLGDDERVRGSGVMRYLHTGTVLTLKDLLTLMVIVSDNSATNMVIDLLGAENVNATMRAIGCTQTVLQRRMYDWAAIETGLDNLCCAREIADLLVRVARKQAVGGGWDDLILDILYHQQDTSKLGLLLPEEAKLANKTGSRDGIMHDCGIVTTARFSYAICVFTRDANSPGEAVLTIARISRTVYDHFAQQSA